MSTNPQHQLQHEVQNPSSETEGVSPSKLFGFAGSNSKDLPHNSPFGIRLPQLVLVCSIHRDTWQFEQGDDVDISGVLEHLAAGLACQISAFIAWTFQTLSLGSVSKIEDRHIIQAGINARSKNIADIHDHLAEIEDDEDLQVINKLTTAIVCDDVAITKSLLNEIVAEINPKA